MGRLCARFLRISPREVTCARRGFRVEDAGVRRRLEEIGITFLDGYRAALEEDRLHALARRLVTGPRESRGFAFEGAAMALALRDHLTLSRRVRWRSFVAGPGAPHVYMVHVGVGWTLARLPWLRVQRTLTRLDPVLRWLALDGYGFHEGYFRGPRAANVPPNRVHGYARRAFDQGLGRSLWFVHGAQVDRIAAAIGAFHPSRQADLWSGIGLASAYAGGVDADTLTRLGAAAGRYRSELAQGVAFAATARLRAGNPAPHTTTACEILCGVPVDLAVQVVDGALDDLPPDGLEPAYEVWRRRIQTRLALRFVA